MLMDALDTFSNADATTIEGAAAGATVYSNTVDLAAIRDLGAALLPISMQWTVLPTSGTGGATIQALVQTSSDNATWTTLFLTGALAMSSFSSTNEFLFRGYVPAGIQRYLRVGYTPSAVMTAGTITTQMGGDWHRVKSYPRNYVA